jgi:hypothetical protein
MHQLALLRLLLGMAARHNLTINDDHRTNWEFARSSSVLGFGQRCTHERGEIKGGDWGG